MAPTASKRTANQNKDKYIINTSDSQTNTDNNENTHSGISDHTLTDIENSSDNLNLDHIDNEILRSLKGRHFSTSHPYSRGVFILPGNRHLQLASE